MYPGLLGFEKLFREIKIITWYFKKIWKIQNLPHHFNYRF